MYGVGNLYLILLPLFSQRKLYKCKIHQHDWNKYKQLEDILQFFKLDFKNKDTLMLSFSRCKKVALISMKELPAFVERKNDGPVSPHHTEFPGNSFAVVCAASTVFFHSALIAAFCFDCF